MIKKEEVIRLLEYSEDMADKFYEKGDKEAYNYWMGKVNAYQNVIGMF